MQDPENVRSFYCMECGAEGDIEHELGDGYEVKYCPFCGSELEEEFTREVEELNDDDPYDI